AGYAVTAGPISVTTPYGTAVSAANILMSSQTFGSIGTVVVNGSPAVLQTSGGSSAELFNGTAGSNLSVSISGVPAGVLGYVVAPNGTALVPGVSLGAGGGSFQIPVLPLTGTY